MIKEYFASLTKPVKALALVSILGVPVSAGLTLVSRYNLHQANEKMREADGLRKQAEEARADAAAAHAVAEDYKKQLVKANKDLAKLREVNDAVHVLPAPGPVPAKKKQLVADLQANGFELVLKPSTTASAYFGVTEKDAGLMWTNTMQALRVPSLEMKIQTQNNLIGGLVDAKNIATAYAAQRTLEADGYHKAADASRNEADSLRVVVKDTQEALKAERKKRLLYSIGALAAGYAVAKKF